MVAKTQVRQRSHFQVKQRLRHDMAVGAGCWPSARSLHIHVQSFGRFDEITDLVEKASALTLPDFGCRHPAIR
jgi:hypothetical protein